MSTLTQLAATAALAALAGRLTAHRQLRRLQRRITDLHRQVHTLTGQLRAADYLATHDPLTGLPNRYAAARAFRHDRSGRPTAAALIDLDQFKHTNDTHGHHVGDDLLRTVAERLARAATTLGATAARLAGDEFLLLIPADGRDPHRTVGDILTELAEPVLLHTDNGDLTVRPRASAGIAVHDGTHGGFDTLLHHADVALYHAKQHRGTHRTYHPQMRIPRNAVRHGPRRRDTHPTNPDQPAGGEAAT